jgi:hypothetical protein
MPILKPKTDPDLAAAKAFLDTIPDQPGLSSIDYVSMILALKQAVATLMAREEKRS